MSKKGFSSPVVPAPAHPSKRREPLPWQTPKSLEDDPQAMARVEAIMASPGYRQADQDVAFLNQDETRGVRLQIDYLKPELLLEQHGVEHTIVVFGSTRLQEPGAARHGRWPRHHGGRQPRCFRRGAQSIGLNITLPHEQYPNPYP